MSKNEIYELLEINAPGENSKLSDPSQNWITHLLIRVGLILGILGGIFILTEIVHYGSNDTLAILLGCILIFIIWLLFIVIETIVLQVKNKRILRNANLILIGFVFLLLLMVLSTFR